MGERNSIPTGCDCGVSPSSGHGHRDHSHAAMPNLESQEISEDLPEITDFTPSSLEVKFYYSGVLSYRKCDKVGVT